MHRNHSPEMPVVALIPPCRLAVQKIKAKATPSFVMVVLGKLLMNGLLLMARVCFRLIMTQELVRRKKIAASVKLIPVIRPGNFVTGVLG